MPCNREKLPCVVRPKSAREQAPGRVEQTPGTTSPAASSPRSRDTAAVWAWPRESASARGATGERIQAFVRSRRLSSCSLAGARHAQRNYEAARPVPLRPGAVPPFKHGSCVCDPGRLQTGVSFGHRMACMCARQRGTSAPHSGLGQGVESAELRRFAQRFRPNSTDYFESLTHT